MGTSLSVAEVIVDVHVLDVDRVFHYQIPPTLKGVLQLGHRVTVPFGGRQRLEGYVIGLLDKSDYSPLRPIHALLDEDPVFDEQTINIAKQASEYYLCPLVQILQCFLPPGVRMRSGRAVKPKMERTISLYHRDVAEQFLKEQTQRAPRQAEVVKVLLEAGKPLPLSRLLADSGASHGTIHALIEKKVVVEKTVRKHRDPFGQMNRKTSSHVLSSDQQKALDAVEERLKAGVFDYLLLEGITGSGKTEVYLRAIGHVLTQNKGAIFLVPEISLTPQMVTHFRETFGSDVALLHSRLSPGERFDEWHRLVSGDAKIVVGARSAVFAPVKDVGLIILDEEHETSYKQDESPAYHARTIATMRAKAQDALLLLGSATPDVTTKYHAERENKIIHLRSRIGNRPLPQTHIIDMREELKQGNRSMFSRALVDGLEQTFRRNGQALLFMNRRGFASFLLCRECGYVPGCDQCEVSMTLHLPASLRCHYCEASTPIPDKCPKCASQYLRPFGGGTQRIHEEFNKRFPHVKALRMDVDTTRRKGSHAKMIAAFSRKEYDCLIGTQMIAKGLHFPGVTCVGVISSDTGLFFPDYRAGERTFQLLTQVAGRAGRGDAPGDVYIQTYAPDHYAIAAARTQSYEHFYMDEIVYRKRTGYPPFSNVVRALWTGEDDDTLIGEADRYTRIISEQAIAGIELLGPTPCPLSKIKGRYRLQTIIKGDRKGVRQAASVLQSAFMEHGSKAVRLFVDVDPLSFM